MAVTLCEFTAHPDRVVAELARVTRPGGQITIGTLNRRSPWGLAHLRHLRRPPWQTARFLTRRQLLALGRDHGHATLHGTLFTPGAAWGLNRTLRAALAAHRTPGVSHLRGAGFGILGRGRNPLRPAGPVPRRVVALPALPSAAGPCSPASPQQS